MSTAFAATAGQGTMTRHARDRMYERGLSLEVIGMALKFGRRIYTRGACIHVIGRKEVDQYRQRGIDLEDCHGLQVVCATDDGHVITAYRNRNFRGLRPRRRIRH